MSSPQEYLRLVVWPREPADGPDGKVHRYVLVGMLVTQAPIQNLQGNEFLLDGVTYGIGDLLAMVRQATPAFPLGDASSVLASLEDIVRGPET